MTNKKSRDLRKRFFRKKMPEYRRSPVLFAREVLLFEPDGWQKTALMDLAQNPKVAIKSGQGVGKTGLEAVALLWFLCCFPYPRIVATAPTKQQLHDVLWSEISKWMSRSPLLSEIHERQRKALVCRCQDCHEAGEYAGLPRGQYAVHHR